MLNRSGWIEAAFLEVYRDAGGLKVVEHDCRVGDARLFILCSDQDVVHED